MSRLRRAEERFALSIDRLRQAVGLLATSLRQDEDDDEGRDSSPPPASPHPGRLLGPPSPKAIDVASVLVDGPSGAPGVLSETGNTDPDVLSHTAQMRDIVSAMIKGENVDTDSGGDHNSKHNKNTDDDNNNSSADNNNADDAGPAKIASGDRGNAGSWAVAACSTRSEKLESAEESSDDDNDDDKDMAASLIASIMEARNRVLKLRVKLATANKRATMGRSGKDFVNCVFFFLSSGRAIGRSFG